ncbi:MAG: hypothetical protein AC479_08405 [miscellaneous Crenarchaeota group-6 archaeon AD8-1]|nr:MAG: hypothetical protein AC479_08405 [miscellaneous Crenarchaeota group-6 archaeon AD8-1]
MKPFKNISDPEAFKLMADKTRRKIIFLLRAKEMTVSQIAHELNITHHLIESYYQATAEVFHFTIGKTSRGKKVLKEETKVALKALERNFKARQYRFHDKSNCARICRNTFNVR